MALDKEYVPDSKKRLSLDQLSRVRERRQGTNLYWETVGKQREEPAKGDARQIHAQLLDQMMVYFWKVQCDKVGEDQLVRPRRDEIGGVVSRRQDAREDRNERPVRLL